MALEAGVLAGHDRLAQHRSDVVVANDDPPLGREFTNLLAVDRDQAGDRARLVVIQRADRRDIVGVDEDQATECAQEGGHDEEREEARLPGESDDDTGARPER